MKKVLITGKNSYIGRSFKRWITQNKFDYTVDFISVKSDEWKNEAFNNYDVILHAAALVHSNKYSQEEHNIINRDLTLEIATKAKNEGVKHFIFLSTMAIYGVEEGTISATTKPKPKTPYGKAKLEAEKLLNFLNDKEFKVSIIRPPMIYGPSCKGNYIRLSKLAHNTPFFPYINNSRSMLFIDNLSEFIRLVIMYELEGVYTPQNSEYVNTSELVQTIKKSNNKTILLIKSIAFFINYFIKKSSILQKIFGTLIYDKEISQLFDHQRNRLNYNVIAFEESIVRTESKE
ncbi:NAD-dependent epimerase/dehydratase family protein [Bacillus zanthoxyli]|nr:NAD-dependent epimerase/dehydratase family protein [Bacillus zanthoxyli]